MDSEKFDKRDIASALDFLASDDTKWSIDVPSEEFFEIIRKMAVLRGSSEILEVREIEMRHYNNFVRVARLKGKWGMFTHMSTFIDGGDSNQKKAILVVDGKIRIYNPTVIMEIYMGKGNPND